MIDLPEHAAQIAIWKHFDDPCYHFADTYRFDWFTPYLVGYAIVRVVATFVSVTTALKIVIYLVIVAIPFALRALLVRAGRDPWLSLLGFPLAFGFSFYWGFLNFLVAIPIAILYLALLYDFSLRPEMARAVIVTVALLVLVVAHALLALYCIAATAILAISAGPLRRMVTCMVPVLPATIALGWWTIHLRSVDVVSHRPPNWSLGLFRLPGLPSMWLAGDSDPYAAAFFCVVVLAVLLMRVRLTRDPRRWVFFAIAAIAFLIAPSSALGVSFLFQRSAILVAVGFLFALDEAEPKAIGRMLLAGVVIGWLVLLTIRFRRFGLEAADIEPLLARMAPNRRLAYYISLPYSSALPGAVYLHFPAYYQERNGGLASWSFASAAPQLVRFRSDAVPHLGGRPLTAAPNIDWSGAAAFDYVLVRAASNPAPLLAPNAPYPFAEAMHSGTWWLYTTPRGRTVLATCPALE